MNKLTPHRDALLELKKLEQNFDRALEKVEQYRSYEGTLGVEAAAIPQVEQFQTKF